MGQCAVTDVDVRPHCALNDSCDCEQTCTKSDHRDGLIDLVQRWERPGRGRGILRNADCGKLSRGNLRKIRCGFFLRNEG